MSRCADHRFITVSGIAAVPGASIMLRSIETNYNQHPSRLRFIRPTSIDQGETASVNHELARQHSDTAGVMSARVLGSPGRSQCCSNRRGSGIRWTLTIRVGRPRCCGGVTRLGDQARSIRPLRSIPRLIRQR